MGNYFKLFVVFLLLPFAGFSQSEKAMRKMTTHTLFVQHKTIGVGFCGESSIQVYLGKKEVFFTYWGGSLDLKVVSRPFKDLWFAKDKEGNRVMIQSLGNGKGMMFVSKQQLIIISSENVCD